MKRLTQLIVACGCSLLFTSCNNSKLEEENKRLVTENTRLVKEIATQKASFDSLKLTFDALQKQALAISNEKDTLKMQVTKQAQLEALRKKAESTPLEMPSIVIQNENEKGAVLKAKEPFKKADARYISFKGTAINNLAKMGKPLSGRLLGVYRLGTLVQQMRTTSGTFMSADGMNRIYTHSWSISSDKESIALDKGIGDKSRGIFQAGQWTLELWFEPKGKTKAYLLAESKFQIN